MKNIRIVLQLALQLPVENPRCNQRDNETTKCYYSIQFIESNLSVSHMTVDNQYEAPSDAKTVLD